VPADEGIGLDDQRHPPIEQPTHGGHQPPGSIVGPVRLDLPLLEERQLLSQKQVFRSQRCAGTYHQDKRRPRLKKATHAVRKQCRRAVRKINNPDMNAQDRTLPDVTSCDPATGPRFCASHPDDFSNKRPQIRIGRIKTTIRSIAGQVLITIQLVATHGR
jgi:hypothetical protein